MNTETIQIFSPHIDDAVFSLGGSMLNWKRKGVNIKVHNIFTVSTWITPNSVSGIKEPMDQQRVTALRRSEEAVVGAYMGFDFCFLDFLEYPLRNFFSKSDDENMRSQILDAISNCINSEDLFFFPIGIEHPDHLIINEFAKRFINKGLKVYFYEDMPYYSWGRFDYSCAYEAQLKDKIPVFEPINYSEKANVLRKYSSQVCEEFINSIRSYSYNQRDNKYYERYWKQL